MKKSSGSKKRRDTTNDSTLLIIFLVLLLFIIYFFGNSRMHETSVSQTQEILLSKLVAQDEKEDGPAIVIGNTVDDSRVKKLASTDYSEIKSMVGVTSDFVIYFEDEQGNVVNIADKPCIGSSYVQVNGVNCNN